MRWLSSMSLAALVGCGAENIVVAEFETDASPDATVADDAGPDATVDARAADAGVSTMPNDAALSCRDRGSCAADTFCARPSCATPGVCTPRPSSCDNTLAPVCGCDGVTYVNDCVRRLLEASLDHDGACGREGLRCDPRRPRCNDDAVCVRSVGARDECSPDAPGYCWALGDCSMRNRFELRFRACGPDGPGCVDLCEAYRSDRPLILTEECRP